MVLGNVSANCTAGAEFNTSSRLSDASGTHLSYTSKASLRYSAGSGIAMVSLEAMKPSGKIWSTKSLGFSSCWTCGAETYAWNIPRKAEHNSGRAFDSPKVSTIYTTMFCPCVGFLDNDLPVAKRVSNVSVQSVWVPVESLPKSSHTDSTAWTKSSGTG